MPITTNSQDTGFQLPADLDAKDFEKILSNGKGPGDFGRQKANVGHFDNQTFQDAVPNWGLKPPSPTPGKSDGNTGSASADQATSDGATPTKPPSEGPISTKPTAGGPLADTPPPGGSLSNGPTADGDFDIGAQTLEAKDDSILTDDPAKGSTTFTKGSGPTDPALATKPGAQGADPTLIAHLERYANDVASGRESPPDLIAAIKALGVEDPDAKIKELGIVGTKNEDPALAAHMARYEGYKASGQDVPPDLISAIEAAGGSIGGTAGGKPGGAGSAGETQTDGTDGAADIAGAGAPAGGTADLGAPAGGAGGTDGTGAPAGGAGGPAGAGAPAGGAGATSAFTATQSKEIITALLGISDPRTKPSPEAIEKAFTASEKYGISAGYLMEPDALTTARLLGIPDAATMDEASLTTLLNKKLPAGFFEGPLDSKDLEALLEALDSPSGAQGEDE